MVVLITDRAKVTCFSNNDSDENCNQKHMWVPQGQDVTLQCRARGFPVPWVNISCSGGQSNDSIGERVFLLLANFSKQDVGSCNCSADNGVGGRGTSSATHAVALFR